MKVLLFFILCGMIGGIIPNAFAEEQVPNWIKNTAGWWAQDAISEFEFVNAIEFLINEEIIQVSTSDSTSNSKGVPRNKNKCPHELQRHE